MKQLILGINPGIYGLNYHDPAVCLMDENKIIFAIEEERFNGVKHSCGRFPENSVKTCIEIAREKKGEITDISVGYQPGLWSKRLNVNATCHYDSRMVLATKLRILCGLPTAKVSFYEHHLAHVASAFYCSGFKRSLCVVFDGAGELASASIWLASVSGIEKLDEVVMPNSLGYFYAQATLFAGFQPWNEEGKLMALAPYGEKDGHIEKCLEKIFYDKDTEYDVSKLVSPCLKNGFLLDIQLSNEIFSQFFGFRARKKDEVITDIYKNFAYSVQLHIERSVGQYIKKWLLKTDEEYLCCAGGLFMNCKMNGYLRDTLPLKKIFVQPVAGDAGTAIGAACLKRSHINKLPVELNGLSLGIDFSDKEILNAISSGNCDYTITDNPAKEAAMLLAERKLIAWFQGKCEFGNRALCHRSILAPPFPSSIADEINSRIKHRELWRPFACSILDRFANEILWNYEKSQKPDYMIEAFTVRESWKNKITAVIHKSDKTTRPQMIRRESVNNLTYQMLEYFYELTGYPLVLNTSLNDKGQPIVTSPAQAVKFFREHDIDALIIGRFILRK